MSVRAYSTSIYHIKAAVLLSLLIFVPGTIGVACIAIYSDNATIAIIMWLMLGIIPLIFKSKIMNFLSSAATIEFDENRITIDTMGSTTFKRKTVSIPFADITGYKWNLGDTLTQLNLYLKDGSNRNFIFKEGVIRQIRRTTFLP